MPTTLQRSAYQSKLLDVQHARQPARRSQLKLHLVEAVTAGAGGNWGKFAVAKWGEEEWNWISALDDPDDPRRALGLPPVPLLKEIGWRSPHLIWVLDLQTGEGALFSPDGYAVDHLERHQIWVCPLFEPFLIWLYRQDLTKLDQLPPLVELNAPFDFRGYRRIGRRLTFPVLPGPGVCNGPNLI